MGTGRGGREGKEKKTAAKEVVGSFLVFFFCSCFLPPTFIQSLYFSPPLLLSWELSFELLELFGGAVSVYQFVCALVRACVWEVAN